MARPALPAIGIAVLLVLAGCAGSPLGDAGPGDVEPRVVSSSSTGGRCVDQPSHGLDVTGRTESGVMTVAVAGNATVPGAHFVVDEMAVSRLDETSFRLDVNTTADPDKSARECPEGGVAHYELTLELPATDPFSLEIRQDGEPVGTLGAGGDG